MLVVRRTVNGSLLTEANVISGYTTIRFFCLFIEHKYSGVLGILN